MAPSLGAAALVGALAAPSTGDAATRILAIAPGGEDSRACTRSSPCRSLARAVARAPAHSIVEVSGGHYPAEIIRPRPSGRGGKVVVRPRSGGGPVYFDNLDIHRSDLEIRSVSTRGWYVRPGAARVTLRGVSSVGGAAFITSADDVSVIGGRIIDVNSKDGLQIKGSGSSTPRRLLIQGVRIARITRTSDPAAHTECIQVLGARALVIRDSVLRSARLRGCSSRRIWAG